MAGRSRNPRAANLNQDLLTFYRGDFAWGRLIANALALPGLRLLIAPHIGYVGNSATAQVIDLSGQARVLTLNGPPTAGVTQVAGLPDVPHLNFTAASSHNLQRTVETGIRITTDLFQFAWCNPAAATVTTGNRLMGRFLPGGNQRCWNMGINGTPTWQAVISTDGTNLTLIDDGGSSVTTGVWYFIAMRFTPSLDLWVGSAATGLRKFTNTTSIPATIFDSTTAGLRIGAQDTPSTYWDGKVGLAGLCAAAIHDETVEALFAQGRVLYGI
jgi:hypothetical protein